jgi:hypothetical protein
MYRSNKNAYLLRLLPKLNRTQAYIAYKHHLYRGHCPQKTFKHNHTT